MRLLWDAVVRLDLRAFARTPGVVEGGPGRRAADPALLVALWRYATTQGGTQARVLDRLWHEHVASIWWCGGVAVHSPTLRDFRTGHGPALDALMTAGLGHLCHAGLVAFDHVARDGVRVRASAGAASFRRQPRLEQCLAQAQTVLARPGGGAGRRPARGRRRPARRPRRPWRPRRPHCAGAGGAGAGRPGAARPPRGGARGHPGRAGGQAEGQGA